MCPNPNPVKNVINIVINHVINTKVNNREFLAQPYRVRLSVLLFARHVTVFELLAYVILWDGLLPPMLVPIGRWRFTLLVWEYAYVRNLKSRA